jgi:hypothetical protein
MIIIFIFLTFSILLVIKRYFPIYFRLRFKGISVKADIVGEKISTFGLIPIVSYELNGVKYEKITPIESEIASRQVFTKKNIIIYLNINEPEKCVINSDFHVIIYTLLTFIFLAGFIYSLFTL